MADTVESRLLRLPSALRVALELACDGDWRRVTLDADGGFVVHNKPQAKGAVQALKQPRKRAAAKRAPKVIDITDDVVVLPEPRDALREPPPPATPAEPVGRVPTPRKLVKAPAEKKSLRTKVNLEELASALGTDRPGIEPGVNVVGSTQAERDAREAARAEGRKAEMVHVAPLVQGPEAISFDWAAVDLGETAQRMCEAWRGGLPPQMGYSYLPDVLALYGLDQDLVNSALRHPERVEVRPESFNKDKGYVVLGFYRGDVLAVLGLRDPARPCVIACYVTAKLENDTHRVGHTGGGGKKNEGGLPKTPKQLAVRLRAMGAEVALDERRSTAEVKFHGQELGSINCGTIVTRAQVESDFQRMQRKIHAIERREASVPV